MKVKQYKSSFATIANIFIKREILEMLFSLSANISATLREHFLHFRLLWPKKSTSGFWLFWCY